jgi:hypothetical protein
LYQAPADGSSPPTRVSPKYRYAVYDTTEDGNLLAGRWGINDIELLDQRSGDVTPLLDDERYNERGPVLSPDKRWLAYVSDRSKQFEVWVRPFPHVDDRLIPTSRGGGTRPIWSANGRFIYSWTGSAMVRAQFDPDSGRVIGHPDEFPRELRPGRYWTRVRPSPGRHALPDAFAAGTRTDTLPRRRSFMSSTGTSSWSVLRQRSEAGGAGRRHLVPERVHDRR